MIRNAGYILLAALLLQSCTDLGSSTAPGILPGSQLSSAKFVVDFFVVECTVKVNPNNDSLWAYFPYTLKYHFEGCPGSISSVNFLLAGFLGTYISIDSAYPDSVYKSYVLSNGIWANSSLTNLDSVVVKCALRGVYWSPTSGDPGFLGTFDWGTEQKIPVGHQ